jgi:hypothetical protein
MVSINLTEVESKQQIAKIIQEKMVNNGIKKGEIVFGTHLSISAVKSVLSINENEKDYMFSSLLKVLNFLKIKIIIGNDLENNSKVLSLFNK